VLDVADIGMITVIQLIPRFHKKLFREVFLRWIISQCSEHMPIERPLMTLNKMEICLLFGHLFWMRLSVHK
jgi:hypothetical protein